MENAVDKVINNEKMAVLSHFSVSRETREKLERYVLLVFEWNERINLVSKNSLPHIWKRHIMDSAQLLSFIPANAESVVDLGSGAGFPGMVLAIMGARGVHLVESVGKKARFLRFVAEKLGLEVKIIHGRIEEIFHFKADVITARALCSLPKLLWLAKPLMHDNSMGLFLKGEKIQEELTEASKYWKFAYERIPSLSDESGSILKISRLETLRPYDSRRKTKTRRED